MSNLGIWIQSPLSTYQVKDELGSHYILPLHHVGSDNRSVGVLFRKGGFNRYLRINPYKIYSIESGPNLVVPITHGTRHLLLPKPSPILSPIWGELQGHWITDSQIRKSNFFSLRISRCHLTYGSFRQPQNRRLTTETESFSTPAP